MADDGGPEEEPQVSSRLAQLLQAKGGEVREGYIPKMGPGVEPDHALVALPGLGPHPARDVGEPVVQVGAEARRWIGRSG